MNVVLRNEEGANPFWIALNADHADMGLGTERARRYPGDVLPFAALCDPSAEAMADLRELLAPGESTFVVADALPSVDGVTLTPPMPVWQMGLPAGLTEGESRHEAATIEQLTGADAEAMVELTDVAFPGFFRKETYRLGRYFGVRREGQLVAMGGERLSLAGAKEISALCTRPGHTGRGYAEQLIRRLVDEHERAGTRSFLHVTATNTRAIALYERLGFVKIREIMNNKVTRSG